MQKKPVPFLNTNRYIKMSKTSWAHITVSKLLPLKFFHLKHSLLASCSHSILVSPNLYEKIENKSKLKQGQTVLKQRRYTERQKYCQSISGIKKRQFFANLNFIIRGQKSYCDGHTDKIIFTISCAFWICILS